MRWISFIWDSEAGEPPSLGYEDPWILKDPRLPEFEKIPGGEGPFEVVSTFLVFVFLHGNRIIMLFHCLPYIYIFFLLDDVLFVI